MNISRRSVVAMPLLMIMGVHSGCLLVCNERAQPHREQQAANAVRPQTKRELLDILQKEYAGTLDIREEWAPDAHAGTVAAAAHPITTAAFRETTNAQEQPPSLQPPAPPTLSSASLDVRAAEIAKRASCMTMQDFCDALEWMQRYRACEERTETLVADTIDCNDHGNVHCHTLAFRHGVPMHLVAYWPSDPEKTGKNSWHLVAACKLDHDHYLILDNRTQATFWHGSLSQYGETYPGRNEGWESMEVIPVVGIAKYIRPKYLDSTFNKGALQLLGTCTERDMDMLTLEDESSSPRSTPIRDLLISLFRR